MSLSFFWGKEKTTLATIMGFGIALGGLLLMTFQSVTTQDAPNPLLGNLLELVAMGFAAGYTTLSRYLGMRYSAFFLTATQMFIGTIFFAPAILFPASPCTSGIAVPPVARHRLSGNGGQRWGV